MAFYHPHGDGAIYDALAAHGAGLLAALPADRRARQLRLARPQRPARRASRYTEARLAPLAMQLLASIDEDTVDMSPTYDGSTTEPDRAARRGSPTCSSTAAAGSRSGWPPTSRRTTCARSSTRPCTCSTTPTRRVARPHAVRAGARLPDRRADPRSRAGSPRSTRPVAARCACARSPRSRRDARGAVRIVVSELPYQTSAEVIGQKIAEIVDERRVEGIRDVRNESSGDTVRLVVDLKRDANAQVVLNQLYKHTPMQTNFAVNLLALVDGVPRLLDLRDALGHYIAHQVEVITPPLAVPARRGAQARAHRRGPAAGARHDRRDHHAHPRQRRRRSRARRARSSSRSRSPRSRPHTSSTWPLRRLAAARRPEAARGVHRAAGRRSPSSRRSSPTTPSCARSSAKSCSRCARSTATSAARAITFDPGAIDTLDLIDDEELVVVVSKSGYVKTVAADAFRRQSRGGRGVRGGEAARRGLRRAPPHDDRALVPVVLLEPRPGLPAARARDPAQGTHRAGIALVNLISLQPDEHVEAIIDTRTYEDGAYLFFATRKGTVKKTRMGEYDSSLRSGLIALNLHDGDELVQVVQTSGNDDIVMVSRDGMTIRFSEDDVRPMGRAAAGVRGMRLKNGEDGVVSCDVAREGAVMLFVSSSGHGKRTPLDEFHRQGRGGQGVRGMKLTGGRGEVVAAFTVSEDDEMLVFSSGGNIVRMGVSEISQQGRAGDRRARRAARRRARASSRSPGCSRPTRPREADGAEVECCTTEVEADAESEASAPIPIPMPIRRGRLRWRAASRSTPNRC